MPELNAISETCLYPHDLNAAVEFYGGVLGLRLVATMDGRGVVFRVSETQVLILFDPSVTRTEASIAPKHGCEGEGHVAFSIEPKDLSTWRDYLKLHGVPIETEVEWPRGGHSIYFRDPAGTSVELVAGPLWPE